MSDIDPVPTPPPAPAPAPAPALEPSIVLATRPVPASRGDSSAWIWLLVALLLGAAGYLFWDLRNVEKSHDQATQEEQQVTRRLQDEVATLQHDAAGVKHDGEGLRSRLDDAAKVNESLRGQLLGLSERARLAEDAIANLADKRLSGHDSLLLNEAELLLVLGGERYRLFHDPAPSISAYRLADAALAEANNAAFSTIRQSISGEIGALVAVQATNVGAIEDELSQLRSRLAQLPPSKTGGTPDGEPSSRWAQIFGQFVRISRDDESRALSSRTDPLLSRALIDASLREAQAALLLRDTAAFRRAVAAARVQLGQSFDAHSADVGAALERLDVLGKLELAPPAPEVIGAALKELRNLRAMQALHSDPPPAPPPASPPAAPPAPSTAASAAPGGKT